MITNLILNCDSAWALTPFRISNAMQNLHVTGKHCSFSIYLSITQQQILLDQNQIRITDVISGHQLDLQKVNNH